MNLELSLKSIQDYCSLLLAQYPVELAYLYGSAASGAVTQFSDIDIAIVATSGAIDPSHRLRFELLLEDEIAERCFVSNADVRIVNDAPLALLGQVVTEGVLLYARSEQSRIDFETRTRLEFFDFQPVLETLRKQFFHSVLTKGINGKRAKDRRDVAQFKQLPALSA